MSTHSLTPKSAIGASMQKINFNTTLTAARMHSAAIVDAILSAAAAFRLPGVTKNKRLEKNKHGGNEKRLPLGCGATTNGSRGKTRPPNAYK